MLRIVYESVKAEICDILQSLPIQSPRNLDFSAVFAFFGKLSYPQVIHTMWESSVPIVVLIGYHSRPFGLIAQLVRAHP